MKLIDEIKSKASKLNKRIVFPESMDVRTLKAAIFLMDNKICTPILIGDSNEVKLFASKSGLNLPDSIQIIHPVSDPRFVEYSLWFFEKRKSKGLSEDAAKSLMQSSLYFAASMVVHNDADGCVSGAVNTTGDVLKAAFQVIGMKKGSSVVSSIFLMSLPDGRNFTYGDCAVVPYPDSEQLASIAVDSAETHERLIGTEPKVAMLSFSTKGSAKHDMVGLVQNAFHIAKRKNPTLHIDGELQFDAALLPEIGNKKAPDSEVAGIANVFIFPNLDAGNIAYKITERLAGATATGPIIQGLNAPMNDLSRGSSWEDIVNTAAVTCLQAQ
ncbi:MAG TPA: phosphate acetyltransferase [Bacteroidetes bacterium]|nr:phosphate acetyltransferase [Bacteroidota bacterium]